jgi:anti-anti-sigma factor
MTQRIFVTKSDSCLTISITGYFNFEVHSQFKDCILDAKDYARVIVDLARVEYIDSSALGMLLLLREDYAKIPVELINASKDVYRILNISNFDRLFIIHKSVEAESNDSSNFIKV